MTRRKSRVLIVEDQFVVALEMADALAAAGCEVLGPVSTVAAALALAREESLDAALLDINVDGEDVYPVAEELRRRGVRIVFATGYAESAVREEWRAFPRLTKPFAAEELVQMLRPANLG